MGWKTFSAAGLLALALMFVGTSAFLALPTRTADNLLVKRGLVAPADQDARDNAHFRSSKDKNQNAANALVLNGVMPTTTKSGTTTYARIWGDHQPDGTVTAPTTPPAEGGGVLPADGGATTTYTFDPCRDANPAATAIGLVSCPAASASATTSTTGTSTSGTAGGSATTGGATTGSATPGAATPGAATIGTTGATTATTTTTHP